MVYKAAVQILKKADSLKLKVSQKYDLLQDSEIWTYQQQLQAVYHQVLVLDLEYALDKKVEQELWTLGFKNHITALQEMARDKKNPKRSESQALLSWCLEAASGFYLTLLEELCTAFGLDFPFRRKGSVYGQIKECTVEPTNLPQSSSCLYICQYCLVHLGDIARYRNQRKQSESFYKQAILVSPTSGHPYNQLALLEASQGNKLSTVFHYVRSIAVKNPFPAAATNLMNALSSAIDKEGPITEDNTKLTASEFINLFLCVHGLLHTATDLDQAQRGVKIMNSALTALVATQSFTAEKLLEMTAVNFYALWHTADGNVSKAEELTSDEMKVKELILDLLAGSISAFLIPVHTLKTDESLLEYYALPAVKLLLQWIQNEPELLKQNVFSCRLQIWPSLCKLLNNFQLFLKEFSYNDYENIPLPEDTEIQGFLPLAMLLKGLDFKAKEVEDKSVLLRIRAKRLVDFGIWLCEVDVNTKKLVIMNEGENGLKLFEPACTQPDPTENLLEEMRSVSLVETTSVITKPKVAEKRGGILKPQGSLEKNREEREQVLLVGDDGSGISEGGGIISLNLGGNKDSSKLKRVRQNVALQSIFKKMEENKQVKFNVESTEKEEKELKIESKPAPRPNHNTPSITTGNLGIVKKPLRTQTFSQNHPALHSLSAEIPSDLINPNMQNLPKQQVNVLPPLPAQKNLPFPVMNQNTYNTQQNLPQQQRCLPQNQQNSINVIPQPQTYQNVQYPQHSPWKQDEPKLPNSSAPWWPNVNQSYLQQDNYTLNMQYPNSVPYMNSNASYSNMDYANKQHGMPGYSPWGQQANFPGQMPGQNQNLSMRQVMLKETTNMPNFGSPGQAVCRPNGQMDKPPANSHMMPNAGAYSLFNTNSWNPNLPAQLKTTRPHENISNMQQQHQHSLFAGHGPQSLAQLLEQQNKWQKGDS